MHALTSACELIVKMAQAQCGGREGGQGKTGRLRTGRLLYARTLRGPLDPTLSTRLNESGYAEVGTHLTWKQRTPVCMNSSGRAAAAAAAAAAGAHARASSAAASSAGGVSPIAAASSAVYSPSTSAAICRQARKGRRKGWKRRGRLTTAGMPDAQGDGAVPRPRTTLPSDAPKRQLSNPTHPPAHAPLPRST